MIKKVLWAEGAALYNSCGSFTLSDFTVQASYFKGGVRINVLD